MAEKPRGVLGFEKGTDGCPTVTVIANVAGKKGRAVQSLYTHIYGAVKFVLGFYIISNLYVFRVAQKKNLKTIILIK